MSTFSGHVGWGISWYINGLLIPEINVVRGKSYTFVVEGGNDPETPAKYHPFYITDDPVGGFEYKTEEEKAVRYTHCATTQSIEIHFVFRTFAFLLVFIVQEMVQLFQRASVACAIGPPIRMDHQLMNIRRLEPTSAV